MKTRFYVILFISACILQFSYAQEKEKTLDNFPFNEANWTVENTAGIKSEIKIVEYKGKQALLLEASQVAHLKDQKFENFEIEFYCNGNFPGLGFRVIDNKNYEYLYLRVPMGDNRDALQYVPIFNGSLPWQLYNYPRYEGKATFPKKEVVVLPLTFESELIEGKVSERLLRGLEDKGFPFSEESEIVLANETLNYIFDPKDKNVLLFKKTDRQIAFLDFRTWIRTKVVVIGNKMSVYIEDMDNPVFVVDNLKRDSEEGGIRLISDFDQVYFSEVSVKAIKKKDASYKDSHQKLISHNFLSKWNISEMFTKDSSNVMSQVDSLLKIETKFKTIQADKDGLINISRFYDDMTKTVLLYCNIISDTEKTKALNFDYADHLVILLDSKIVFDQGMNFQPPSGKGEEGRVFVEDEHIELNLRKGINKLIFVLTADNRQQFNWGFIAKMKDLDGITKK